MTYIAKTIAGIEKIAAKETGGKSIAPKTIELKDQPKQQRTITTIYAKEFDCTFSTFEDLQEKLQKAKFKIEGSCQIVCNREGEHGFRSVDVAQALSEHLRKEGITTTYANPTTTIYVDIMSDHCYAGRLIAKDLQRRSYRVRHNNQSINACIAAAMVLTAKPKKEEVILDPFCKDAVISIEAWMQGYKKVRAYDASRNNVRNAGINCKMAKTDILPQVYDASWLETLFKKEEIDHVITTIHLSNRTKDTSHMKSCLEAAKKIVSKSMTVCVIQPEPMKEMMPREFRLVKEYRVSVGEMHYSILHFKKKAS